MSNKKEKEYVQDAAEVGLLDRPIELGDLRRNPEGIVHVDTRLEAVQQCTVVDARSIGGYGGPLAVENQHGLSKGFHRDGLYTLSNGQRYIVPFEIHEALGIPFPPFPEVPGEETPPEPEVAAAAKDDGFDDFK